MGIRLDHRALLATAGLAALLATGAAIAGSEDAVSSDGSQVSERDAALYSGAAGTKTLSPPYAGAARVTAEALHREGVSIYGGTEFTAAEVKAIAALRDKASSTSTGGAEVIIGQDRRERVYTTYFPSRARVLITFSGGRCSGTLIGPNTVVTAGHCVHSGGSGGSWYATSSYLIYAGANGTSKPYGSCTAKSLHSVSGWSSSGNEEFDYGAIKLNCTIGNTVGWYGYTSSVSTNLPAIIGGYPGDKPLTQWIHADKVRAITANQIFYSNDTTPGSSGSGVWWDSNGAVLIGIHAYGTHGSSPHSLYNHGKRITASTLSNFDLWKNLP